MKIDLKILKDYGFEDFNDEDYIKYMSIKQFKKHLIDVIKLSRKQALEEVKMMIDERYFEDRKIGKGTGRFWEEFKQQINKLEENGKNI